jgi:hypothetical protein
MLVLTIPDPSFSRAVLTGTEMAFLIKMINARM